MSELHDKIKAVKDELAKIRDALLINPNSEYDKAELARREAQLEELNSQLPVEQPTINADKIVTGQVESVDSHEDHGMTGPEPTTEAPKTEQPPKKKHWYSDII